MTGGGGLHFYFRWPGFAVSNSAGKLGGGLDVRGNGGQVVAPGSRHKSGAIYAWAPERGPRVDGDRKSTRLNSSHLVISYAVFCLKKKKTSADLLHTHDALRPFVIGEMFHHDLRAPSKCLAVITDIPVARGCRRVVASRDRPPLNA